MQVDLASALSVGGTFDNAGELRGDGAQLQTGKLDHRGLMVLDNGASLQAQRFETNSAQMELRQATIDGGQIFTNAPGAVLILDKANISAAVLSLQGTLRGSGVLKGDIHQFGKLATGQSSGT